MEHPGTALLDKGTRLGKFEIERLVGVGSMGAVYEGVLADTRERFAIKVLSPVLAAVPSARARFLKEAKLTARVRHPHIVAVSAVGEDAGQSYFAMEMLEGEDLLRRLQRSGPLSAAETVDIMLPVCDAVAEAHRRGITHRDLKPSNIFLTLRAERTHPIVLDFGIAKDEEAAGSGDAAVAVAARRAVFGTPYYLAPEQVADHRAAGPASDQYALGVILYECLTGEPPYSGDSVEELFRAIAAGNPAPPSTRRPDVPHDLDAVVLRALTVDPKRRFGSVAELRRKLHSFASKSAGDALALSLRKPSSPAIEVEAKTPSPFRQTLTPEIETLSGAWFEAAESESESESGSSPTASDAAPDEKLPQWAEDIEAPPARSWRLPSRRGLWVGAAGAFAVASLVLAVVATRGASAPQSAQAIAAPPAEVLVQIEPAPAKPPAPVPVPPVAEEPPAEPVPVPAAAQPAAVQPAVAPPAAAQPVAVQPDVAPPAAVRPAVQPAVAQPAAVRPAAVRPAVAQPAVPAPSDVPAAGGPSRARKSADKPRARASDGIRMHNGVPLLD